MRKLEFNCIKLGGDITSQKLELTPLGQNFGTLEELVWNYGSPQETTVTPGQFLLGQNDFFDPENFLLI